LPNKIGSRGLALHNTGAFGGGLDGYSLVVTLLHEIADGSDIKAGRLVILKNRDYVFVIESSKNLSANDFGKTSLATKVKTAVLTHTLDIIGVSSGAGGRSKLSIHAEQV